MLNAPYTYASSLNLTKFLHLQKKKKQNTLLFMLTEIYNKFYDGDSRKKRDICLGIVTPEKKEGT